MQFALQVQDDMRFLANDRNSIPDEAGLDLYLHQFVLGEGDEASIAGTEFHIGYS